LSQSAADCSAAFSSVASAKSSVVQPIFSISTSIVPRWPEPGLPMFTRLPLRSSKLSMPASARATTVKGSGWTEKTDRSSSKGPALSKEEVPL
jgi:hypothetical protein